jgi:ribonucleotide monophosphatase NagD (HAD superfamily)
MPGAGAMVYSIQYALKNQDDGKPIQPLVLGKPNPYVVGLIMRQHGITEKDS